MQKDKKLEVYIFKVFFTIDISGFSLNNSKSKRNEVISGQFY